MPDIPIIMQQVTSTTAEVEYYKCLTLGGSEVNKSESFSLKWYCPVPFSPPIKLYRLVSNINLVEYNSNMETARVHKRDWIRKNGQERKGEREVM